MSKIVITSKGHINTELVILSDDPDVDILIAEFSTNGEFPDRSFTKAEVNHDPNQAKIAFDLFERSTAKSQVDEIDRQILILNRKKASLLEHVKSDQIPDQAA